jgi:DNA-binding beta-propeller fold protein YncE
MIQKGRQTRKFGGRTRLAWISLAAICVATLCASSASADSGYRYWTSFGRDVLGSQAREIAVDNSTGSSKHDLYVWDTFHYRVVKFGPDGNLILMFGDEVDATDGGDVCTVASGHQCQPGTPSSWELEPGEPSPGFNNVTDIAVSPATGAVYVLESSHSRILKFDPGGHRTTTWADEGELRLPAIRAITVDEFGRLMVARSIDEGEAVDYFDEGATAIKSVPMDLGWASGLDVDQSGHIYTVASWSELREIAADGSRVRGFTAEWSGEGFVVDRSTGAVFVPNRQNGIQVFAANCPGDPCAPGLTIGDRYLPWAGDLGLDESSKRLFGFNYDGFGPEVAILLPGTEIPAVTTGAATATGEEEALLRGTIDATGAPTATGCYFEYVGNDEFESDRFRGAASVPCTQHGPFTSPRAVSARVTGLHEGVSYHFRLVASLEGKVVPGAEERFRTPILPSAKTGPASNVEAESVTLAGSVVSPAKLQVLTCNFELVAESAFLESDFSEATEFPCDPRPFYATDRDVPVQAIAKPLIPGTTYRYRVVVVNADATQTGVSKTFTTARKSDHLPDRPEKEEPPRQKPRPPSGKVPCAKRACSKLLAASPRAQTWTSPRFPRSYGWLFDIFVDGDALHHTKLEGGCASTFSGHGVIALINGCNGRIRVVYRGRTTLRVRWRVFAKCRCADVAEGKR